MFSVEIPTKNSQHQWQFVRFGGLGITWIIVVEDYTPTRGCFSCFSVCALKWFIVLSEKEGNENEERIIQQRLKEKKKVEEIRFAPPQRHCNIRGKVCRQTWELLHVCLWLGSLTAEFSCVFRREDGKWKRDYIYFFLYCSVPNFRLI